MVPVAVALFGVSVLDARIVQYGQPFVVTARFVDLGMKRLGKSQSWVLMV